MDKSEIFVGVRPVGRAAQAVVQAQLQQSRGVSVLAVLVRSYSEFKFRLALARERPASGDHQANEQGRERAINGHSPLAAESVRDALLHARLQFDCLDVGRKRPVPQLYPMFARPERYRS